MKRTIEEAMMRKSGWTPERRAKQAEAIRRWQPWKKSTGPRTVEGKVKSSRNADKGISALHSRIAQARLNCRAVHEAEAMRYLKRLQEIGF